EILDILGVKDATRIFEKGPEYLRKQMEAKNDMGGRMTAVEMLAASKKQYVKSQQVVNSVQEPVSSFGSASVSSNGSSNRSSNWSGRNSGNNLPAGTSVVLRGPLSLEDKNTARRTSSKRRDSLLLYRQKCDLVKAGCSQPQQPETQLLSTDEERMDIGNQASKQSPGVMRRPDHKRVAEVQTRARKGVGRSHSDISSRYSKNFADFDAFFKYCGLDGDVVNALGKENFSSRSDETESKISASVSMSDDGFSQHSNEDSNDALLEEELHETIRQGTSVIERNARVIKWLYSCKNAKDSGKTLRDLN
uniref:Uncharacterized protein n=1 Tax=Esox lucius TaxID=8010 RepID=A0A3P8YES1_ESOLU